MKIPKHTKCVNCGECCGPVPCSKDELNKIKNYVEHMEPALKERLKNQKREMFDCQFRDKTLKNCAIYPVRPLICKLFGVTKGMYCNCGNSAEIDGYKIMGKEKRYIMPKLL